MPEDQAALEIVEIVSHLWIESSRRADSGNGGESVQNTGPLVRFEDCFP
jgi:hypothetical protein